MKNRVFTSYYKRNGALEAPPKSTIAHQKRPPSRIKNMPSKLEMVEGVSCNRRNHELPCSLHLQIKTPLKLQMKGLNGLSNYQLGWESFTLEIG